MTTWRTGLVGLWFLVTGLLLIPHVLIIYLQSLSSVDITYSASVLNSQWSRFDDIVKLYPSWHFAENLTIFGKLSVAEAQSEIFPNVIQESIVILPNSLAIWLTGNLSAPFYLASILTGLAAVLIAELLRRWTNMPFLSLSGAFFTIFCHHFLSPDYLLRIGMNPSYLLEFLQNQIDTPVSYNSFYRVHSLGATYFILVSYIFWLWTTLEKERIKMLGICAGSILLALQFYSYLFYSVLASGITLVAIIAVWARSHIEKGNPADCKNARSLIITCVMAAVLAFPSWYNTLSLVFSNESADWIERIKGMVVNKPFWATEVMTILSLVFLAVLPTWSLRVIFAGIGLTVIFFENTGYLFGFSIQPGHLFRRAASPLLFTGLVVLMASLSGALIKSRYMIWAGRAILVSAMICSIYIVITWADNYARYNWPDQGITGDEYNILAWIDKNTASDSTWAVLFPNLNEKIAVHGGVDVYLPFGGHHSTAVKNEEIISRLATMLWLAGATPSDVEKYVVPGFPEWRFERYAYYYLQRLYNSKTLNSLAREIKDRISALDNNGPVKTKLPTYIIIGGEGPIMALFTSPLLSRLSYQASFGEYTLYRVKRINE